MGIKRQTVIAAPFILIGVAVAAGCSSTSTSPSPSPSPSRTQTGSPSPSHTSASPSPTTAACTQAAIQAALPKGQVVTQFKCGEAGVEYWAGGSTTVNGKATPFFLRSEKGNWVTVPVGEVCGTAMAGLPPKILEFCNLQS